MTQKDDERLIVLPGADEAEPDDTPPEDSGERALLLAADLGRYDAERSLAELGALCEANGCEVVAEVTQRRASPDPATAIGTGRLAEAALLAKNLGANLAVFDGELSGSQLRNLEKALGIPVMDRTMLILEIFARRAVSREGKTQTELARLEYRLPRLSGLGTALSRQGGGGAGGGGARRGGGETQLEYDRRAIRSRISVLKKRLAAMDKRRGETRRAREKSGVPLIAFVGYTNVGKSSLVNALAGSDIAAADMLFATLDPTARRVALPGGLSAVLIDTVGFVSRLPHGLVEAFKSTLEVAKYADLLVQVCDAADPHSADQLAVTAEVLGEIGVSAGVPRITVYNKCDLLRNSAPFDTGAILTSAATGEGLGRLSEAMAAALQDRMRPVAALLPYSATPLVDVLRRRGEVTLVDYRPEGIYVEGSIEAAEAHHFAQYLVRKEER